MGGSLLVFFFFCLLLFFLAGQWRLELKRSFLFLRGFLGFGFDFLVCVLLVAVNFSLLLFCLFVCLLVCLFACLLACLLACFACLLLCLPFCICLWFQPGFLVCCCVVLF